MVADEHKTAAASADGAIARDENSEYFSSRVEEMMQSRSQFSSVEEHEIEYSKVHWSEVRHGLSGVSEVSTAADPESTSLSDPSKANDYEEVDRENTEVFVELRDDPRWAHPIFGPFFREWLEGRRLGRKIAEGGQGAIFEIEESDGTTSENSVVKVFKRGTCLSDLRKLWPNAILIREQGSLLFPIFWASMLDDGRFAFEMRKFWGDLRKLIDHAMQVENNPGPPFPYEWNGITVYTSDIMFQIAMRMRKLHETNVLHRHLKAANVLIEVNGKKLNVLVADFECSIGVVGTGFWRAPEVLLALNERRAIDFNENVDVYSYGMTFFEVVTGRLPFEGELKACKANYDLVIDGRRPKLPSEMDLTMKALIESCWNPIRVSDLVFPKFVNHYCHWS